MGTITTSFHSSCIVAYATTTMFLLVALAMLILFFTDQISNRQQPPNFVGPGDVRLLLLISWLLHPSQASLCVVQVMACVVIFLINYQLLLALVMFVSSSCLPVLVTGPSSNHLLLLLASLSLVHPLFLFVSSSLICFFFL